MTFGKFSQFYLYVCAKITKLKFFFAEIEKIFLEFLRLEKFQDVENVRLLKRSFGYFEAKILIDVPPRTQRRGPQAAYEFQQHMIKAFINKLGQPNQSEMIRKFAIATLKRRGQRQAECFQSEVLPFLENLYSEQIAKTKERRRKADLAAKKSKLSSNIS